MSKESDPTSRANHAVTIDAASYRTFKEEFVEAEVLEAVRRIKSMSKAAVCLRRIEKLRRRMQA